MTAESPYGSIGPKMTNLEIHEDAVASFDWSREEARLTKQLETLNDPTAFLEYLTRFHHEHFESEHWDEYLRWVRDHADAILDLSFSDIPGVADRAIIVLSDTHAFLEERSIDDELETERSELRSKILNFFSSHLSLFTVDGNTSYRFDLRIQTLSKICFLCVDAAPAILAVASLLGVETLKKGWTDANRSDSPESTHADLSFDVGNIVESMKAEELEVIANEMARKAGVKLDLRKQRFAKTTDSTKEAVHHQHLSEWIASTTALEGHTQGASHELQERFGIVNFHHFPIKILINQYDLRDKEVPYGVVIAAQFDHNDAFNRFGSINVLNSFSEQLSTRGVHMRIIEVDSPRSIAKKILSLNATYGDHHKISFALVRAHGAENHIELGAREEDVLTQESLTSLRAENLSRFFISEPQIIFDSCSVGATGGLAAEVANVLNGTTWGSPVDFRGIKDIEVLGTADHLEFSITPNEDVEISAFRGKDVL